MLKFIIFSILFSTQIHAAEACLEITERQLSDWTGLKPKTPVLADLIRAVNLVESEKAHSLKLGNDKRAHCYMGCRIRAEINFETAQFVAWQKEYSDATDCDPKTHFEVADYEATIQGAKKITKKCADFCKKQY